MSARTKADLEDARMHNEFIIENTVRHPVSEDMQWFEPPDGYSLLYVQDSPDGRFYAAIGYDQKTEEEGAILLWDAVTQEWIVIDTMTGGYSPRARSMSWTASGQLVVQQEYSLFANPESVDIAVLERDATITGPVEGIAVVDPTTGETTWLILYEQSRNRAAFATDRDGYIHVVLREQDRFNITEYSPTGEIVDEREVPRPTSGSIQRFEYIPDQDRLWAEHAALPDTDAVSIGYIEVGTPTPEYVEVIRDVSLTAIDPAGEHLIGVSLETDAHGRRIVGRFQYIDIATGLRADLAPESGGLWPLSFSADGSFIYARGFEDGGFIPGQGESRRGSLGIFRIPVPEIESGVPASR